MLEGTVVNSTLVLLLLASLIQVLDALSMSPIMGPNHECFYVTSKKKQYLNLYLSSSDSNHSHSPEMSMVDLKIFSPRKGNQNQPSIMLDEPKISRFDRKIRLDEVGRYSVCLYHSHTYNRKEIDADFTFVDLEDDKGANNAEGSKNAAADKPTDAAAELAKELEKVGINLQGSLNDLLHTQHRFKERIRKHRSTVENIMKLIRRFSLGVAGLIIGMGVLQVVILRTFFTSSGSIRV